MPEEKQAGFLKENKRVFENKQVLSYQWCDISERDLEPLEFFLPHVYVTYSN